MNVSNSRKKHKQSNAIRIGLPIQSGVHRQRLSPHFGRASEVLLVDEKSGERTVMDNTSKHCGKGTCGPVEIFINFGVNTVICRSLGQGAYRRLREASIAVFRTQFESVEESLAAFHSGELERFPEAEVCSDHHHYVSH